MFWWTCIHVNMFFDSLAHSLSLSLLYTLSLSSSKSLKKSKIKEPSYQTVASKGGGLVRVYTATVSPFEHRVVVVCTKKSTVSEVVATALAKCGKHDLDPKRWVSSLCLSLFLPPSLFFSLPSSLSISLSLPSPSLFLPLRSLPDSAPYNVDSRVNQPLLTTTVCHCPHVHMLTVCSLYKCTCVCTSSCP